MNESLTAESRVPGGSVVSTANNPDGTPRDVLVLLNDRYYVATEFKLVFEPVKKSAEITCKPDTVSEKILRHFMETLLDVGEPSLTQQFELFVIKELLDNIGELPHRASVDFDNARKYFLYSLEIDPHDLDQSEDAERFRYESALADGWRHLEYLV